MTEGIKQTDRVETPLLRAQTSKGSRGFESHPLRQFPSFSAALRLLALTGWKPGPRCFVQPHPEQSGILRRIPYTFGTVNSRFVPG